MITLKIFKKNNITKKYISWLNNKELMKYTRHKKLIFNKQKCIKFYKQIKLNKNLFFAIYSKKKHVGNIIAYIDLIKKEAELSILTTQRSTGYPSYKKIIKILKKKNINKIYSGTNIKNIKMIKLCIKLNMKIYKRTKSYILYSRNI
jgi:hypothetical protein